VVAKWVVIDMASTDNLIELVAWQYGVLALVGITLAIGLATLNGALIGVSIDRGGAPRWALLAIVTPVMAVMSWAALSFALVPGALVFLLGPQRGTDLGGVALMLLCMAAHVAAAAVLAGGRWTVGPLVDDMRQPVRIRRHPAPEALA
jgi:hypothetical protein